MSNPCYIVPKYLIHQTVVTWIPHRLSSRIIFPSLIVREKENASRYDIEILSLMTLTYLVCNQGTSAMLSSFEHEMPALQAALLAKEHHPGLGKPCMCGSLNARFRCRSCTHQALQCHSCIRNSHALLAWHHIDEWVADHFKRMSLHSLGYRHRLGHLGQQCPHHSKSSTVRKMVVLHTNGFHHVSVEFCACPGRLTEPYQLMDADLFPSSFKQPETAFTFELLDMFERISLRSKINVYDYHRTLQEMTSAAFAQDVPVR